MASVAQLKAYAKTIFNQNTAWLTRSDKQAEFDKISTKQGLLDWLMAQQTISTTGSGMSKNVDAWESKLYNNISNETLPATTSTNPTSGNSMAVGSATNNSYRDRINKVMRGVYPGFMGSIANYYDYDSYVNFVKNNPSLTDTQLATHIQNDAVLSGFADQNGWNPGSTAKTSDSGQIPINVLPNVVLPDQVVSSDGESSTYSVPGPVGGATGTTQKGSQAPSLGDVGEILKYATGGKIGPDELTVYTAEWAAKAQYENLTYDGLAARIAEDATIKAIASGGGVTSEYSIPRPDGEGPTYSIPGPVGGTQTYSIPSPAPAFNLIKGDGGPKGPNELRGNGNAVFLVSSSGELFHVTAGLAEQMKSNGTWSEPVEKPQGEVDAMTLRMSLNHTAELGVLDIPQTGEFMLVKGDGPALSTNQLNGNGDAVYAIDKQGNKFHVTGAVAEQMQKAGTWTTPAVLNQGTIDAKPPTGALASPTGGTAPLSIPLDGNNVVPIAAGVAANIVGSGASAGATAGASVATSAPAPALKLIRGNGPNLGTSQLFGNGAAVYAVLPDGTKLHVTAAMAEKLKEAGRWVEPVPQPQWEIDSTPPAGTLASVDGAVGGFDTPLHAPQASAPAPAPTPTPAAPAPTPQLSQSDRDQIAGMYRQYLGREASPGEIDHHGAGILNGSNNMAQINLNIANSPEAKNYQASVVAQADAAKIAGINAQVNSLFQQYVGRAADAEDLRIHGSALASGVVTADTLKQQLAAAPESQAYRSNLINNTFQKYVGRAADSADHQIHGTALASGAVDANKFVASIATAPEAVAYQNSVGMPKYTQ